jgi:signal transduction histidine kinase
LARLGKGEISLNKTKFDCVLLLRKVIEKNRGKIKSRGLELTYELSEEINIEGDKERLVQMFDSLLSNAIKYTGRGGQNISFRAKLIRRI